MNEINNKNNKNNQEQETLESEELYELENELEQLRRELEDEKNRHLRTHADFDNFRKRIDRDTEANRNYIKKDILLDLITFLDYFDQARKQVQDPAAARGIEIMARQFTELLYKYGVRPVECLGQPFDPKEQEGIGYVSTDHCPEGCVAEEVCSGWKLGDILLKPAQVLVAREQAEDDKKILEESEIKNQDLE